MVAVINLEHTTCLAMRLVPPTLIQRWGDFNDHHSTTYPVGTSDEPSSLGILIDFTFLDDVVFSLQPAIRND